MVALRVEALHRVGGVVDDLQLALLVIVAVSAVKDTVSVSRLITELTVVSGKRKVVQDRSWTGFNNIPSAGVISKSVAVGAFLAMDLESHLLRLSISLLKMDSHDIYLGFSQEYLLTGWKLAAPA